MTRTDLLAIQESHTALVRRLLANPTKELQDAEAASAHRLMLARLAYHTN